MKEIELSQGQVTLVDDDMFEELNEHTWYAMWEGRHWYAVRKSPSIDGKQHTIYMHRVVTNAQPGQQVDHANRNGLHNWRANLRLCTGTQNRANSKKRAGCSSKYKGVCWDKHAGKWMAQIRVSGEQIYLGYFVNEIEAAFAYNKAATKHFGEFARSDTLYAPSTFVEPNTFAKARIIQGGVVQAKGGLAH